MTNGTEGLEVYFVNSITDDTDGFQIPSGIVIGEITTDTVLAHEIGHACGLNDIYDFGDGMSVTGMPQKVYFTHYYKHWHLSNAPVGFKLHGNRHPVSE